MAYTGSMAKRRRARQPPVGAPWSRKGVPNAAYFEFFSTGPNDRATLDKNGKIIAVPPMPPGHRVD